MKLTYDHRADALYLKVKAGVPVQTRRANATRLLHLDNTIRSLAWSCCM